MRFLQEMGAMKWMGLLVLTLGAIRPGLALDSARVLSQAVVASWSREDGLPLNSVYAITQTPDGFLWLGTQAGAVRFDGTTFEVFRGGDDSGLEGDILTGVMRDAQGRLWVSGQAGLFRQEESGRFRKISLGSTAEENRVLEVYMAADGAIWGNRPMGGFVLRADKVSSLGRRYLFNLTSSPDGRYTVATFSDGITVYTPEGEGPLPALGHGVPDNPMAMAFDADNRLWVAAGNGLWRWQGGAFSRVWETPLSDVTWMTMDRTGNIWMGFRAGGGARFHTGRGQLEKIEGVLGETRLTAFYEDREGNLWVGTDDEGLWRFRDGPFVTLGPPEGLPYRTVNALAEATDGTFYVGTYRGGLFWKKGEAMGTYTTEHGLAMMEVTSLRPGLDGDVWIGFPDGRVQNLWNGVFTTYTSEEGLARTPVTQLLLDAEGRVWAGHISGGLRRKEEGRFVGVPLAEEAPLMITAAYRDTADVLWFGTHAGLIRFQAGRLTKVEGGVPEVLISGVIETKPGELWLSTDRAGIGRLRDGQYRQIPVQDLPSAVFALMPDDQGRLWMISNDGVSCVTLADIAAYEMGKLAVVPRLHFGVKEGLRSLEGRGVVGPAAWRTRDGTIHFATERGVSSVNPLAIGPAGGPAGVRVTGVAVDAERQTLTGELGLMPGWKSLRFDYSALELGAPERLFYETRLEGYDKFWRAAGHRREAVYTNLPPGNYVFRVRVRRTDGGAFVQAAHPFVVQPAYYQTTWFWGLCAGGVMGALIGIYRLRSHQLRKRNDVLERLVEARTRELEAGNAILARANAFKDRVMRVIGHDLIGPAASLRALVQMMIGRSERLTERELRELGQDIDRSAQAQVDLLTNLLAWGRGQNGEGGMERALLPAIRPVEEACRLLALSAQEKNVALRVQADSSLQVFADAAALGTVLRNLVANALKFTPSGGAVSVTVEAIDGRVVYRVQDTGIGMTPEYRAALFDSSAPTGRLGTRGETGTGLGLLLCRDLLLANGGELQIESVPGAGTVVICSLPARPSRREGEGAGLERSIFVRE